MEVEILLPSSDRKKFDGASAMERKTVTPKPFLRKGSRKEPSALNRIAKDGSTPSPKHTFSEKSTINKFSMMTSTTPSASDNLRLNDERILQDTWQSRSPSRSGSQTKLNLSTNPIRYTSNGYDEGEPACNNSSNDASLSINDASSLSITDTVDVQQNLMQKRDLAVKELDEFEQIERQLENISIEPSMISTSIVTFSRGKLRHIFNNIQSYDA